MSMERLSIRWIYTPKHGRSVQEIRQRSRPAGSYADRSAKAPISCCRFFLKRELDEFGAVLDKYRGALFKKQYMPRVEAFPKVRELFERIRHGGKRIALASSAKEDELASYKKIRTDR